MIKMRTFLIISIFAAGLLVIKFLGPERQNVGPLEVLVTDVNYYTLPYVRVEIENLEKDYKTEARNSGRYFDGPFFEGKHRVVVKLGEHSNEMNSVVYNYVHDFTKDMKILNIRLENVRQRFNIEIAEPEIKIPVVPYAEWKDIFLSSYENRYTERKDINAPVELKILDDIEDIFHANMAMLLRSFRYITFIRQEYSVGKWIYHVIFTNSQPKPHNRTDGGIYNLTFSTPNISFTVSQDITSMNKINYSSSGLAIPSFTATAVQTTFETKDFLPK